MVVETSTTAQAVVDTAVQAGVAAGQAQVAAEQATEAAASAGHAVETVALVAGVQTEFQAEIFARLSEISVRLSALEHPEETETPDEDREGASQETTVETVAAEEATPEADEAAEPVITKHRKYRRM